MRLNPDLAGDVESATTIVAVLSARRIGSPRPMIMAEFGRLHEPDTTVQSFVVGPMLLRGTRQVAFIQERLLEVLGDFAELKGVEPPCEFPPIVETLTWHPRSTDDPAHAWLRGQLHAVANSLAHSAASSSRRRTRPPVRRIARW